MPGETNELWRPWSFLSAAQLEFSPSIRNGMSKKAEKKARQFGLLTIRNAGIKLRQSMEVIATAQMYYSRFFALKAYQRNDNFCFACAALFVACKTELQPRHLNHVIYYCWKSWLEMWIKNRKKAKECKHFPERKWNQIMHDEMNALKNEKLYLVLFEAVCSAERSLLYSTGFQFNVYTAFHFLVRTNARLTRHPDPAIRDFFSTIDLQAVWNFVIAVYDSTRLCLQYDPRTIGIACYEAACFCLHKEPPMVNGEEWWKYVAKLPTHSWDLGIGNPKGVLLVLRELDAMYKKVDSADGSTPFAGLIDKKANALAAAGAPQPPLPPPTVSPLHQGISPGQTSSQTQDETMYGQRGSPWNQTSLPPLPDGSQPPLQPPLPMGGMSRQASLQAALPPQRPKRERASEFPGPYQEASHSDGKRQKLDSSFDFSPSAEFSISPDKEATLAPPLPADIEEGEILLDEGPPLPVVQDPEVLKARLAKARLLANKHDGGQSDVSESSRPQKPPDLAPVEADDDLDVHFSP